MDQFLQLVIAGLGAGGTYALLALGTVIIYRGSGIVSFCSGGFGLVGALVYFELTKDGAFPTGLAILLGTVAAALVGGAVAVGVMWPLRRSAAITRVIATLGVLAVIQEAAVRRYGMGTDFVSSFLSSESYEFGSARIQQDRLFLLGITVVLAVALLAFYRYTLFGLATTGVAQNERAIACRGWSPATVAAGNWALGGALSGFAGICICSVINGSISPSSLTLAIVPALAAALVGGFVSFPLTLVGGLLVGVLEVLSLKYVTAPGWPSAMPFLVVLLVLVIRGRSIPLRDHAQALLPAVSNGRIRKVPLLSAAVVAIGTVELFTSNWAAAIVTTMIFALLCLSVVAVLGLGGQLSLAQYAIAGIAALFAARLSSVWGVPLPLVLLLTIMMTVPVGLLVALPAVRVRGVNLAVVTLGMAVAIRGVVFSNESFTKGARVSGVAQELRIPRASLFGLRLDAITHPERYAMFSIVVFVLFAIAVANVRRGRSGRRLLAVRDNERAAMSLGISVPGAKLFAFGLGSAVAAAAGVLITYRNTTVQFDQFGVFESVQLVLLTVIGSVGSVVGAIVGGALAPAATIDYVVGLFVDQSGWFPLISAVLLLLTVMTNPDGIVVGAVRLVRRRWRNPVAWTRSPLLAEAASQSQQPALPANHVRAKTLEIENVSLAFGSTRALDGVSLVVRPGEVVGLIGPNGAGKTTLIDVACGFHRNYGGRVLLDGEPCDRLNPTGRARAGLTRSFQSLELFEDLSVADNLRAASDPRDRRAYLRDALGSRPVGLAPVAQMSVEEFGLAHLLDKKPSELSFGQRRLVAIARAVATAPSILLLDEPAAGLDAASTEELGHLVRRLATQWGMGVLLVEHDVHMVMSTCHRIVGIDFGTKIAEGAPAEIRNDPALVAAYLGPEEAHATL